MLLSVQASDSVPIQRCIESGGGRRTYMRDLLSGIAVLDEVSGEALESMAAGATVRDCKAGAPVFGRGSQPDGLFFVLQGGVRLMAPVTDGRGRVVELFEPGQMFGEIGVFTGESYRTWTEAVMSSSLVHVSRDAVLVAVAVDHAFCRRLLNGLAMRVQRLIDGIGRASPGAADARVAAYLLELAEAGDPLARWLTLPAPKGTIASLLNLSQECFSRVLRRLRDSGVLCMCGRRISICDRDRLRALVGAGR